MEIKKHKVWNKRDHNCPKDAVYVGRPSKWGNPFKIDKDGDRENVISLYRQYVIGKMQYDSQFNIKELKGKDLVCWCAPLPCHADVLLELAE